MIRCRCGDGWGRGKESKDLVKDPDDTGKDQSQIGRGENGPKRKETTGGRQKIELVFLISFLLIKRSVMKMKVAGIYECNTLVKIDDRE